MLRQAGVLLLTLGAFAVQAGSAGADEGSVTNVTSDAAGHLTVSWSLTKPTTGTGTVYLQFVCVQQGTINLADAALSECTHWYSPPTQSTSDTNPAGSFTTPDVFTTGTTYQVSLMVDYIYTFYSDAYYDSPSTTCSADLNPYDPWLFICATGTQSWLAPVNYTIPDTTPPSAISSPEAVASNNGTTVQLAWLAATDNVGVTGYRISRNGTEIATTQADYYLDTGLQAHTAYTYVISAVDAAGNVGPPIQVQATTSYQCVVPNVKGMTVTAAARKLSQSHCALGKVTRVLGKPKSRVHSQSIPSGLHLALGTRIAIKAGK